MTSLAVSKIRRKSENNIPCQTGKDLYNPFPDQPHDSFHDRQAGTPPKVSKRAWKCFQLVLICQKLLKPFSSSSKEPEPEIGKHTLSFNHMSRLQNRSSEARPVTAPTPGMVNIAVQTNTGDAGTDLCQPIRYPLPCSHREEDDFTVDLSESTKAPYWDLDIDSAIVGDFNSMSTLSLDEQIDPHYAIIKFPTDGPFIGKSDCAGESMFRSAIYQVSNLTSLNNDSPKSGIYSKIMKQKKADHFSSQINEYYRLKSGARLDFDQIMRIKSQLGLSRDHVSYHPPSSRSMATTDEVDPTPDIPRRAYGSSVINYITGLRQAHEYESSGVNPSLINLDRDLSSSNVYSPIWMAERRYYDRIANFSDTPSTEPIAPKRSINKILHQLNPTYRDDSSEDASSTSFNSPFKLKYSYPRNFSENYSRKSSFGSVRKSQVNVLGDEISRFRHMDSEVDVSAPSVRQPMVVNHKASNGPINDAGVPLDVARFDELHFMCDEKIFLQPLMERSCEEDYFTRDFLSSLDYINV